jgi:membrane peptidoglycan carboxypeptidase
MKSSRFASLSRLGLVFLIVLMASSALVAAKPSRQTRKSPAKSPVKLRHQSAKSNRAEARRLAARRRAEAARMAALARQRAIEESMRARVQYMIAQDDTRGEDAEIRRVVVNALGNHAGTVVVMDPKTGRVFSIVNQQWAVQETFKPCSTIKLVTGVAGLTEQVIDPNNSAVSDLNHVNLTQALAYSKNGYFQQIGSQVGINRMVAHARQLGLGSKTGINLSNESAGRLPSLALSGENRVFSHGDGFRITALQLATLASTFATHGRIVVPFIPRTGDAEKSASRRSVAADAAVWQAMTPGMVGSVRYGSGRKAYDPSEIIAGKTGTCIDNGQWVGLFTSYAPLNDPKLAIVVIARGSDGRNHFPAAVAGRIYRELSSRFVNANDMNIARTNNSALPAATDADDEESEEADTAAQSDSGTEALKPVWGDGMMRAGSKVKPTVMALPQNPSPKRPPTATHERPRRVSPLPQ